MAKYVMALDAGTTSNRCILFDHSGAVRSMAQKEFRQYYPQPGWVEHDASEIWATQLAVAVEAMAKIGAKAEDIAAIGITNHIVGSNRRESARDHHRLGQGDRGTAVQRHCVAVPPHLRIR